MLSMDEATGAIRLFNRDPRMPAADAVVTAAFSAQVDQRSHYVRVTLLDSLWATNLATSPPPRGRPRKSVLEISESLRGSLGNIEAQLQCLESQDLMAMDLEYEDVRNIVRCLVGTVVACCNNRALSFVGKYLHFLRPTIFPPWDSIVPKEVKHFLPNLALGAANTTDNYLALMKAHQLIWWGFAEQAREVLLEYDFNTQPSEWRQYNTPVRVIDKALWQLGRDRLKS